MKNVPFEAGAYYHVFNRGNNKENIFIEERNYYFFLRKLSLYLLPVLNVLSYCLLPNHFHLVIQFKEKRVLSEKYRTGKRKLHQPFSNFFNSYAKAFNKANQRTGSLFQEHLPRIQIKDEDYLRDVILYTHLNPENHGIIPDFQSYPYSSFSRILTGRSRIINCSEVLDWFGGKENFRYCHLYRRFRNEQKLEGMGRIDF